MTHGQRPAGSSRNNDQRPSVPGRARRLATRTAVGGSTLAVVAAGTAFAAFAGASAPPQTDTVTNNAAPVKVKCPASASKHCKGKLALKTAKPVQQGSHKAVATLGRFPLPVEVNRFGLRATELAVTDAIRRCGCDGPVVLRQDGGTAFVTDGGHLILDCHLGWIPQPEALAQRLAAVPGVVEHGLFLGIASAVIAAAGDGEVTILGHPGAR